MLDKYKLLYRVALFSFVIPVSILSSGVQSVFYLTERPSGKPSNILGCIIEPRFKTGVNNSS